MDTQKEIELSEELLIANPDFDESLLAKDEDGNYENCEIGDQLGIFQAGIEVAEREARANAKAQAVPKINDSIQAHELTISEIKAEIEEGYDLCQDIYLLDALVERGVQIGKILAVPEGFVLVPKDMPLHILKIGQSYLTSDCLCLDLENAYKAMIEAQEQKG